MSYIYPTSPSHSGIKVIGLFATTAFLTGLAVACLNAGHVKLPSFVNALCSYKGEYVLMGGSLLIGAALLTITQRKHCINENQKTKNEKVFRSNSPEAIGERRAKLINALPEAWKKGTPGLIFDETIIEISKYLYEGQRPDVTGYRYNSVGIHVFYDNFSNELQFYLFEIDAKGIFYIKETVSFENGIFRVHKYIKAFQTPLDLLDYYRELNQKKDLQLAVPIKSIVVPEEIKIHPEYRGEYHNHLTFEPRKESYYSIIYSYDYATYMIVFKHSNVTFSYNEDRQTFFAPVAQVEMPNLHMLLNYFLSKPQSDW